MKYRIVSDTASNLYTFPGVDYVSVPLKIINDEREYLDTPDLNLEAMIEELKKTRLPSRTSCPNIYEWRQAYGDDADCIFVLSISRGLSGSYSAACQAAEEWKNQHPDGKIWVVDTLSACGETYLVMDKMRRGIQAGNSFEQICQEVEEYRKHLHLLFSLQSLTNLARNGRVSPAVAKIAGVLGIRLLGKASDQGTIEPVGKHRGERKALLGIYEKMKELGFAGGRVSIAHCMNPEGADELTRLIRADYPESNVHICKCTALACFYAEKGGLIIGFEDADV